MESLPSIGQIYGTAKVLRVTAASGEHRWVYYTDLITNEWHGLRLDLFLKKYSK